MKVVCAGGQVNGGDLESVNVSLVAAPYCCTDQRSRPRRLRLSSAIIRQTCDRVRTLIHVWSTAVSKLRFFWGVCQPRRPRLRAVRGYHFGTVTMLYALRRARQRVNPSCPAPVQCLYALDRKTHRGHAKATEIREPLLRPVVAGNGHLQGQRWPYRILELHRAAYRTRSSTLANPSGKARGNRRAVRRHDHPRRKARGDTTYRGLVRGLHLLDRNASSIRG